ncbi:palmitoyl-acyl carrier protein thioesterase, chloroplastic-like [Zingiber officinale]|uniref:palmitoyl-acyl carrier protein thioesterase, chloroplastic-like n=1 Tax=Zingiber officinale TaxID=94328 RepID=UPI001C4B5980|nr:palmitoyl-acyl carrier protein thioesterase, chloroplastic-like [Zingiber officinale]
MGCVHIVVWVMMNKKSRRLPKIPEEVRTDIGCYFVDHNPIIDDDGMTELLKLEDYTADYIQTGFTFRWNGLDVDNQHVNNAKYIGSILEVICFIDIRKPQV